MNETALVSLVMLMTGITALMERPVKPYLKKVLANWGKFDDYSATIFQFVAIGMAFVGVMSVDGASFLAVFDKAPVGTYGKLADIALTAIVVSLGDEGFHNMIDAGRLVFGRKAIEELRAKCLLKSGED